MNNAPAELKDQIDNLLEWHQNRCDALVAEKNYEDMYALYMEWHEWIEEEYEEEPYIGIPAPAYLEYDPWFAPPVYSEKQITVKEAYEHAVADNQILEESGTSEPSDIHERIYQIATASWNTVDETKESMGGSENFHEGPGGWNSGNGWGLYK